MENNNLNGISSASKKVIFGLVGVFAVFIVVMLFFLFNNSVQEGLTTGTDIEVIGASALLDVSNNNERRSNILEQSFRVANMNNKLGEIGFNALPSNDPLLNDDVKVKYNKEIDNYPKKIEFGSGLIVEGSTSGFGITGNAISDTSSGDIEYQAVKFFEKYSGILDIDAGELEVDVKAGSGNFETIRFDQVYRGVPVYLSKTSIAKSGDKWSLFVSSYSHNINLDVNPSVSENDAINNAKEYTGLTQNPINDLELFVYPSFEEGGVSPRLVYKIDFPVVQVKGSLEEEKKMTTSIGDSIMENSENILMSDGKYFGKKSLKKGISGNFSLDSFSQLSVFVNAHTGEIVDVIDNVRDVDISGRSSGEVFPDHYQQDKIGVNISNQEISNEGDDVLTDSEGQYLFSDFTGGDIDSKFTGPYIKVVDFDNDGEEYSYTIDSGVTSDFDFSVLDESYKQEATNVFYHSNLIHDFFANGEYPFNIDGLNFQMIAEINDYPYCNAWANGETIHFFQAVDGSCETLSLSSDVIYHEYTHNMVKVLAPTLAEVYWGHTGNMNEAYADYFGCSLNDDPCMADHSFYGSGRDCLRSCDNSQRFPEDYDPEPHTASMTISGSMWDIRKVVGQEITDTLAMLALEYDPQTFQELADNFIIVDDSFYGDGDLSNGAPHAELICNSFYINHGVYSDYCFDILPLIGILDLPEKVEGQRYLNLTGSVGGTEFSSWELSYSHYGTTDWVLIRDSTELINSGNLFENFDLSNLGDGNVFRLVVENLSGSTMEVEFEMDVTLVSFDSPLDRDVLNGVVKLNVSLVEGFDSVSVDYHYGDWISEGISFNLNGNRVIGEWDTSNIQEAGPYEIRINVSYGQNEFKKIVRVYLDPSLKEGWPVRIHWYGNDYCGFRGGACYYWGGYLEPVVEDLDGDSNKEIIVHSAGNPTQLYIYNSDGSIFRVIDTIFDVPGGNIESFQVFDFDNDGEKEIIVGVQSRDPILVYSLSGELENRYPNGELYMQSRGITSSDINGDGMNEIFYSYSGDNGEAVFINSISYDLTSNSIEPLQGWPKEIASTRCTDLSRYGISIMNPAIGDINQDGEKEIIVLTQELENIEGTDDCIRRGKLLIFDSEGNILLESLIGTDRIRYSGPPIIGDINQDGFKEIIFTTWGDDGHIYIYDYLGNELEGWPKEVQFGFYSVPSVFDLDGDGYLEIAASQGAMPFNMHLYDYLGNELSGWPVQMNWNSYRSVLVADVDGDDAIDIITTAGGNYDCFPTCGGVYAWHKNGTLIKGFPKVTEVDAQYSATIEDIDNDGMLEIVASSDWDYGEGVDKKRGSVYAWDLDAPYNPDAMEWIRYQYDLKQSGCYNCTDEEITPQCSDEIDNDGDGLTDYPDDLDCESEEDRSEFLLVVESQSKIINNEDFDVVGDLIMALQKDDEGVWNDEVTVVDNVEVIIRSGGWIDLGNGEDNEGNQVFNGWNNLEVSAENAGFYRIYINLEFEDTGEIVEGSWEFEVV